MHAIPHSRFPYRTICLACASLLGIGNAAAAVHTISASNFTMVDPVGTIVGGSTDVAGTFDDSMICTDVACTLVNGMTVTSSQNFFGSPWTAHDIRVFGPGTYTFDSFCSAAQIAAGTTSCGGGAPLTLVVGPGQLGGHMLFNWSSSTDIDVIIQWDLNGAFGSPIFAGVPAVHAGTDIWNLVSVDGSGDTNGITQPDGLRGYRMVDGPFINFNANFNLNMSPVFAFNVAPVANNVAASTSTGVPTSWTPSVSDPDSGPSALTCSIVTQPAAGQGTATVASDCSSGTYDPQAFGGPSTSFTYRANDGNLDSNTATVSVTISANPPPVAGNTTLTATGVTPSTVDLAPFITDTDEDLTTLAVSTAAANGSAVSNSDGTVTYTANSGFSGTDSFGYTVDDAAAQTSNEGTVAVTVLADGPSSSTPGYGPGLLAQSVGSTDGSGLTVADVGTDAAMEQQCVGGCADFIVADPSIGASTAVTVVLPLTADIPANAAYRKNIAGSWVGFDTSGANDIASAPALSLTPLVCPAAGSSAYIPGLTAGHRCLQLVIVNDGPNDADAVNANTVADPGGIGVPLPPVAPPSNISDPNTGGCTLNAAGQTPLQHGEWWLLSGFLAWLGWRMRKTQ